MPKLELVPHWDEMSERERKEHLEGVRARRMAAAAVHFEAQSLKLTKLTNALHVKIQTRREALEKSILTLDQQIVRVEGHMEKLNELLNEYNLAKGQMADLPVQNEDEE